MHDCVVKMFELGSSNPDESPGDEIESVSMMSNSSYGKGRVNSGGYIEREL